VRICGTCSIDAMLPEEYIAAAIGKATNLLLRVLSLCSQRFVVVCCMCSCLFNMYNVWRYLGLT